MYSINFSVSFQTPSVSSPPMTEYRSNFRTVSWLNRCMICVLVLHWFLSAKEMFEKKMFRKYSLGPFGFRFKHFFVRHQFNSLFCKMFIFRLSGPEVKWQWMAALIPVNALWFHFSKELSQNSTQVRSSLHPLTIRAESIFQPTHFPLAGKRRYREQLSFGRVYWYKQCQWLLYIVWNVYMLKWTTVIFSRGFEARFHHFRKFLLKFVQTSGR